MELGEDEQLQRGIPPLRWKTRQGENGKISQETDQEDECPNSGHQLSVSNMFGHTDVISVMFLFNTISTWHVKTQNDISQEAVHEIR